ncbi:Meiotically up-regulated gene 113 [uncultured Caudovirales phage]|uniref:Meiotically up-regulated gene 113 n=1 Tax=uncultured Caudovirales phage TaxID=2100421 RepID=A0A6J5M0N3_9CAUD|nr:Meiotically up-regulated gene 113 [uncultured Caudovirales phage]
MNYDKDVSLHIMTGTNQHSTEQSVQNPSKFKHPWAFPKSSPDSVYVIVCGDYCKIGITMNVLGRLKNLECVNPYPVSVAFYEKTNNCRLLEKKVHKLLADKRHNKEWFKIDAEQAIKAIRMVAEESGLLLTPKKIEKSPHGDGTGPSKSTTYEKYHPIE